eukprot:scaffold33626_cov67-Phaeocystis_antarctica.AAC.3
MALRTSSAPSSSWYMAASGRFELFNGGMVWDKVSRRNADSAMDKVWSRNSVSALLLARSVKTSRRAQFSLPGMYEAVRRMSSCSSSARTPTGLGGATMIDSTPVTCESALG